MKKLYPLLTLISFTIILIFSCRKDKDDTTIPLGNGSTSSIRTTISGIVLDESNLPLTAVTVTAYGQSTTTNQFGIFVLKDINADKDRCILKFSKTGFHNRTHCFIASANTVNYIRIVLGSNLITQTFSSVSGGAIILANGSSVTFQPNSFINASGSSYTGTVNVNFKHLSPDDANFSFMIPGGDLLAKNSSNTDVLLNAYGMLGVELTGSNGAQLQLANGKTSTLTFPIAASQLQSAPASIPLWYFDETSSLWKEEGTANKSGTSYVATVNHFSWYGCSWPGPRATIKGKVIDCNGIGLPNVIVSSGNYTLATNQNGEFQNLIPAGFIFTVQVLSSNNSSILLNSQVEIIPSLSQNQIFTIPDLIVQCPSAMAGNLKQCNGSSIDGLVNVAWATGAYSFQYTPNGSFNLPCPANMNVNFNASSFYNSKYYFSSNQYSTLPIGSILQVGNILLCDTVPYDNWVRITGCFLMNDTVLNVYPPLNVNISAVFQNGIQIGLDYNNGINDFLVVTHQGDTTGTYTIQQSTFTTVQWQWTNPNDSTDFRLFTAYTGTITFDVGNVGGYIEGNFSGTGIMRKLGVNAPANFLGQFKVLRLF